MRWRAGLRRVAVLSVCPKGSHLSPWLSLWESCRKSRLRGHIGKADGEGVSVKPTERAYQRAALCSGFFCIFAQRRGYAAGVARSFGTQTTECRTSVPGIV